MKCNFKVLIKKLEKYVEVLTNIEEYKYKNILKSEELKIKNREEIISSLNSILELNIVDFSNFLSKFITEKKLEGRLRYILSDDDFRYALLDKYNIYIPTDVDLNFSNDKEMNILLFKIRTFLYNLKINVKKNQEEIVDKSLLRDVDMVYNHAKNKKLPSLDFDTCKRFCVELNIYSRQKNNISLIKEMVKNKLFEDIISSKISEKKTNTRIYLSKETKKKIFERDKFECQECGSKDYLEIGHKNAVCNGGDNSPENLITLCRKCNSSIGRKNMI